MFAVRLILKHKRAVAEGLLKDSKVLASTGGSFVTPTPLPSVINDTWTAWGSSGTPLRPGTQSYVDLFET